MTKKKETQQEAQLEFAIQRIYVKDFSFEAPNSPKTFLEEWKPDVNLDLKVDNEKLEEGVHDVTLHLTVTVKNKDDVAFLVEVKHAAVFAIKNLPEEQLPHMLGAFCPNIIFPYARERISGMVEAGGFPPLYLAPINFDAVYQQQIQQKNVAND